MTEHPVTTLAAQTARTGELLMATVRESTGSLQVRIAQPFFRALTDCIGLAYECGNDVLVDRLLTTKQDVVGAVHSDTGTIRVRVRRDV